METSCEYISIIVLSNFPMDIGLAGGCNLNSFCTFKLRRTPLFSSKGTLRVTI